MAWWSRWRLHARGWWSLGPRSGQPSHQSALLSCRSTVSCPSCSAGIWFTTNDTSMWLEICTIIYLIWGFLWFLISKKKEEEKEDVHLVEFMYRVFTRMPGESYHRWLRSLLYLCYIFQALINSFVRRRFQFLTQFSSAAGLSNKIKLKSRLPPFSFIQCQRAFCFRFCNLPPSRKSCYVLTVWLGIKALFKAHFWYHFLCWLENITDQFARLCVSCFFLMRQLVQGGSK